LISTDKKNHLIHYISKKISISEKNHVHIREEDYDFDNSNSLTEILLSRKEDWLIDI